MASFRQESGTPRETGAHTLNTYEKFFSFCNKIVRIKEVGINTRDKEREVRQQRTDRGSAWNVSVSNHI